MPRCRSAGVPSPPKAFHSVKSFTPRGRGAPNPSVPGGGSNTCACPAAARSGLRAATWHLPSRPEIASRVVVEITETAALYDIEESARFVCALRETGCRVALDDFGAGHTSLRHLQTLAVDTVKIDGSFVRNLGGSPDNQVFLRHLLGLAKSFGFHTVAEGVETATEAAILRREGIGYMQGYYYGRPSLERLWLQPPVAAPAKLNGHAAKPAAAGD